MPRKSDPNRPIRRHGKERYKTERELMVGHRLRVLQAELGKNDAAMAEFVGVSRQSWSAWCTAENRISDAAVETLIDKTGITSDWIFFGRGAGLPVALFTRLQGRVEGLDPDDTQVRVMLIEGPTKAE